MKDSYFTLYVLKINSISRRLITKKLLVKQLVPEPPQPPLLDTPLFHPCQHNLGSEDHKDQAPISMNGSRARTSLLVVTGHKNCRITRPI